MKHGRQGFITTFIRLAIEGRKIEVFGDGSQLRDFTYVSDAVDAFLAAALTEEPTGARSTSAGRSRSRCSRWPALPGDRRRRRRVETVPWPAERKKIDIGSIYVDHARLTELTGWEPRSACARASSETFAFYREHGEHYRA